MNLLIELFMISVMFGSGNSFISSKATLMLMRDANYSVWIR